MKKSKYFNDGVYICECGRKFINHQSFNGHLSHCKTHHDITNKPLLRIIPKGIMQGWQNKTPEELKLIHKKSGETLKQKIIAGEIIPSFKDHKATEEHKEKIRSGILRNIELNKGGVRCNYNKIACKYIDKLNEENGWNLQHAENGGEQRFGNYWVDGYDKDLNIIFEYDEPKHYIDIENNVLTDKDIKRQQKIIEISKCEKFYRYNEKLNYLYEIFEKQ